MEGAGLLGKPHYVHQHLLIFPRVGAPVVIWVEFAQTFNPKLWAGAEISALHCADAGKWEICVCLLLPLTRLWPGGSGPSPMGAGIADAIGSQMELVASWGWRSRGPQVGQAPGRSPATGPCPCLMLRGSRVLVSSR